VAAAAVFVLHLPRVCRMHLRGQQAKEANSDRHAPTVPMFYRAAYPVV